MSEYLYLATNNTVCAVEKASGEIVWMTDLRHGIWRAWAGSSFVSLSEDEKCLFAHTHGYLYCLIKADGRVLWENELSGLGYELAMLSAGVVPVSTGHQTPVFEQASKSSGVRVGVESWR